MILTLKGEIKMNQLARFDTGALQKAILGIDSMFTDFERRFANQVKTNYPPYNFIKTGGNSYELEVAVTGFNPDEVTVEIDQNQLIVKGERNRDGEVDELNYIHRGLAARNFVRAWLLPEHMEVNEGTIKNGVLKINLNKVIPEALKPRVLKLKAE
jgi:molecular chaperone IbpA